VAGSDPGGATDEALIDEVLDVIADARTRVPRDFLLALAIALGGAAIVLLIIALVSAGSLHDLSLNLTAEVIGVWLTVVLIDGLWKRRQTAESEKLERAARRLESRRDRPMSAEQRQAWQSFVDDYRALVAGESVMDRLRGLPSYGRRISDLEARAERTLDEATDGSDRSIG
jgi:hypothetical protein